MGFIIFTAWVTIQTWMSLYERLLDLYGDSLKAAHLLFYRVALRRTLSVLYRNFKLVDRVRVFIKRWNVILLFVRWQVKSLRQVFLARRRPYLIETSGRILVDKFTTPCNAVMKKVDSRSHAHSSSSLRNSRMDLCLLFPRLSIAVIWIDVIKVLCSIRLFLSARRSLPCLKLLENLTVRIVDWDNRLAEAFTDEVV